MSAFPPLQCFWVLSNRPEFHTKAKNYDCLINPDPACVPKFRFPNRNARKKEARGHHNQQRSLKPHKESIMATQINCADAINVETAYWRQMTGYKNTTKALTRTVVGGLKDLRSTPNTPSPIVDFTPFSLGQMVSHMLDVQEAKLNHRLRVKIDGTQYVTFYGNDAVDSSLESMSLNGIVFTHSFLYNGNPKSFQPGNCVLRRNDVAASYNELIDRHSPEGVLLQLQEIVRRKAIDPRRDNLPDQFANVPVSVGIAMADRLANDGLIDFGLFWLSKNQHRYHMFTGYDRLEAFRRLGIRYVAAYLVGATAQQKIDDMNQLMITFYGPLPIANLNGHVDLNFLYNDV